MVILGIDPGLATTGYALIETDEKRNPTKISWGCITTPAGVPTPARLMEIRTQLLKTITSKKPARAVVEKLFFEKNAKTAMAVGEARGAILSCLAEQHIAILEITPLQMKRALTGQGNADETKRMNESGDRRHGGSAYRRGERGFYGREKRGALHNESFGDLRVKSLAFLHFRRIDILVRRCQKILKLLDQSPKFFRLILNLLKIHTLGIYQGAQGGERSFNLRQETLCLCHKCLIRVLPALKRPYPLFGARELYICLRKAFAKVGHHLDKRLKPPIFFRIRKEIPNQIHGCLRIGFRELLRILDFLAHDSQHDLKLLRIVRKLFVALGGALHALKRAVHLTGLTVSVAQHLGK